HLHRPVASVADNQLLAGVRSQLDGFGGGQYLAGYRGAVSHGIGRCTVTSLVPSGKVASTCTELIISGTPSMTSRRLRIRWPSAIRSATLRPSRALSRTHEVMSATASG